MTLELREVSVRFGELLALDRLSLTVSPQRVTAIIGPPAAGKSVLLKVIARLLTPSAGQLAYDGMPAENTDDQEWHRRVGMAFQNDALFDAMTVYENVAFPLRRRGLAESEVEARVHSLLDAVGLAEAATKLPAEISGGMRKRCGIARAVVLRPEIGLFDDPTAGLDPETSDRIFELIVEQTRDLAGICLVVSNELPSLLAVSETVHVLHQGRLIFSGDPEAVGRCDDPVVHQFVRGLPDGPL